ncbi:NAD(P)/FAD-dependent oxidoreductase [Brachybacterium sp. JHP9]|uniref:NAD(P)/FAD-dependent oxidoreductase n=1 Tax=Brachybacterium equifaecis TaxID=2910770 RepID=A0ABT0R100_9MICO|nr:FAD-dependent oxidoreductase [Brachybacterium equifaecis]MCL6423582.1 NAD(P)/FAD-dependent oxidoreductase [Brachybacterium equifaecis]
MGERRPMREADVVVIGGGQAGISAAHQLQRVPELRAILLDAAEGPGGAWRHRWDSLTMATVNRIADLPGMPLERIDPRTPSRTAVPDYFGRFEQSHGIAFERPVRVVRVRSEHPEAGTDSALLLDSVDPRDGAPLPAIRTRALINATGTWDRPFVPSVPGRESFTGRQLRTVDYTRAEDFAGARIAIVGGGISAAGFLAELSAVATTFWYTRREPVFREGGFGEVEGREAVAMVEERVAAGLAPLSVVSVTGLVWTPALRAAAERGVLERRPMFRRVTPEGVIEHDGTARRLDAILWATGFRASLGHLAPLHLRSAGGGIRMDGTKVAGDPRIHLIGYGPSSSTVGARQAGREAVRRLRRRQAMG